MSAAHIIQTLEVAGIDLQLSDDGRLTAPADSLSHEMRLAIKAHRGEIIDLLARAKWRTKQLIEAAMLTCDYWQDGDAARAQMQQQCLEATPAEQAALLRYFQQTYGGSQDAHK
jgi:hypothetical protein